MKHSIKKHKSILNNMLSLFILQGSNYILPLILLPYLVRTLGVETFGLLAFATATIGFFRGIVSYGFDLSGTQQISIHRNDKNKLTEIFNSILIVKFLLAMISFILLSILLLTVERFHVHWEVFLFTFFIVYGDILFPIWYFQGIEKMKMITYIRLTYKSLFVLSVIAFVHHEDQYLWVPLLDALGSALAGSIALGLIVKQKSVLLQFPKTESIIFQFKNGWHIFISNLAVYFYSSINTFVLGMMTNNVNVGYYAIAEKIYMALRGILSPITQALFPFLAKKYKDNKDSYYNSLKNIIQIFVSALFLLSLGAYIFSPELVLLVSGEQIQKSVEVMHILSIALLFAIGSLFTSFLVIKGEGKILSKITFITMLFNLIFIYPAIYFYGIIGVALLFLTTQVLQTILQIKYNQEIYRKSLR